MTPEVVARLLAVFREDVVGDLAESYMTILAAGLNECWTTASRSKSEQQRRSKAASRSGGTDAQKASIMLATRRAKKAIGEPSHSPIASI
jgi:hypothetical protein